MIQVSCTGDLSILYFYVVVGFSTQWHDSLVGVAYDDKLPL